MDEPAIRAIDHLAREELASFLFDLHRRSNLRDYLENQYRSEGIVSVVKCHRSPPSSALAPESTAPRSATGSACGQRHAVRERLSAVGRTGDGTKGRSWLAGSPEECECEIVRNLPWSSMAWLVVGGMVAACGGDDDQVNPDASGIDAAVADAAAATPDAAGTPDGAPPQPDAAVPDTLFAFLDDKLFRVDSVTAGLTEVGPLGVGAGTFASAAWDPEAGVARLVTSAFSAPTLATVDLCTGTVTQGARLSLDGTDLGQIEGFTIDLASNTVYASVDADRGGVFLSEAIGTVDPTTGAVTVLGTVDTLQDDIDQLSWVDGEVIGLDVLVGTGAELYDVNTTTGATTVRASVPEVVNRLVYDPARGRFLAATARENPRRLVEVDPDTGGLTTIGNTHTDAEHGGLTIDAIVIAPDPNCP